MTTRGLRMNFCGLSLVVMSSSVCGPNAPQSQDDTGNSTGDSSSSAESPTSTSTGASASCSRIHEGDLHIKADTDLATVADIGRVTGNLFIFMERRDQRDLSFLDCLNVIDGVLQIDSNYLLESTKGLENLKSVQVISVYQNPKLRVVTGFDQVHDLVGLKLYSNPALEEIHLESVKTVDWMIVGGCLGAGGDGGHDSLVSLSGFSGLTAVESLHVDGNKALMSADLLDALAANGALSPLGGAYIRFNPLLSEATVQAQLDALGVPVRDVCGNEKGDPECYCEGGG